MLERTVSIIIAFFLALGTLAVSLTRFVARDEGFYLYSARLILEGKVPYRDFFLPQMPLMPYLYAGWFWSFGSSWIAARLLSALIAIACGVVVYTIARHIYGLRSARLAVVLLALSVAFQVWVPLAKNTGLACLLFLLALYFSLVRERHQMAGLCMGLCVLTRLTFAPMALLLIIPRSKEGMVRQMCNVCLGMAPALVLAAWWYGLSPENFVINNLGYHFQRTRLDEEGIANNKHHVLMSLLGVRYCIGGGGRQFCVLLFSAMASLLCAVQKTFEHRILVASAVLFFALSFIPSPTYVQYFCVVATLLAAPAAHCIVTAGDWIRNRSGIAYYSTAGIACFIIIFAWLGSLDMYRYLLSGEKVIGVGAPNHMAWRLGVAREVAAKIDQLNSSNKPVYVSWPGYLVEARSAALAGTENNFGVGWASDKGLKGDKAKALRVLGKKGVAAAFADRSVDVITLFVGRGRKNSLEDAIQNSGARKVENYKEIIFYTR